MYDLIVDLFPIGRSITGEGYRESLDILQKYIPLEIKEVPTGQKVFDWTVPREWNISDAYVKNSKGEKVIDYQVSNLHVVNYSIPVNKTMQLSELKEHLFTLPEYPDWIPYRTSYYNEVWGFCLSHNQFLELEDGEYEVVIDSTLEDGFLTYGEYFLSGSKTDEVLLSCHACHPSLCNDNLSGVALVTFLAKEISRLSFKYSYRFLFTPATIGSITWLALNEPNVSRIKHGLTVACVGDAGHPTYKKTRLGDSEIDRAAIHTLEHSQDEYKILDFSPYGYDERQFCSPGFNLPVGSLMRSPNGDFPEYHTSADDLSFVQAKYLADSFKIYLSIIRILESNEKFLNKNPKCEPQLGKRGLYRSLGGPDVESLSLALLWVLNLSDGENSLLEIADRSGLPFELIQSAAERLVEHDLLEVLPGKVD